MHALDQVESIQHYKYSISSLRKNKETQFSIRLSLRDTLDPTSTKKDSISSTKLKETTLYKG